MKQLHLRDLKPVMEFKDIARALGISEQCVTRSYKKALQKLAAAPLYRELRSGCTASPDSRP